MKNQNEPTRPITAETSRLIECAANDTRELASVLIVMQQAFENGAPDPEITADALNGISGALMRISKSLDHVMKMIYQGNLEKGNE